MPLSDPARPVASRVHGGLDVAELAALAIDPAIVLDVSTSVSPYGTAPEVERAIRSAPLDAYPDPSSVAARTALAEGCGTSVERIVLGNGATELLWTTARVRLGSGETLLSCEPSFSELRAAAAQAGARVVEWRADERSGFALDLPAIARAARDAGARVVGLCVPTSPVGQVVPADELARLADAIAPATLVLDQSFLALSTRCADRVVKMPDNALCVRSLTKEHAIPGVRIGYLIAEPALAARIAAARPSWTVGSMAQAAVIAAVAADDFVARTRARLLDAAATLAGELRTAGYEVLPSQTPYFVVRVGDAAGFRRALLREHRVLVRDCTSFGMPAWVRLAGRDGDAARRIVDGFVALAPGFAIADHALRGRP
jgi:histidinol-phosphate/aromatic aminotransferase/cobyric acid decarboxylase-like protein